MHLNGEDELDNFNKGTTLMECVEQSGRRERLVPLQAT